VQGLPDWQERPTYCRCPLVNRPVEALLPRRPPASLRLRVPHAP